MNKKRYDREGEYFPKVGDILPVRENLIVVHQRIQEALEKGGRCGEQVKLVAVSKRAGIDLIEEAYRFGQRDFGENHVQEWLKKKDQLPEACSWHFVGRLQTNKIKFLDKRIALIHSLDRLALLEALNAEGEKRNHIWNTLLQVNVAEDRAKAGLGIADVPEFFQKAESCRFVRITGLMTIGRGGATPQETRETFAALRVLRDRLLLAGVPGTEELADLSMGMSRDLEIAVEEGATIVRVGSDIFG